MHQVHIGIGSERCGSVVDLQADGSVYQREHIALQASLLKNCPAHLWPKGSSEVAVPRPIFLNRHNRKQIAELHDALTAAITDIVQRWWTDTRSCFPEKMPLTEKETDLLQWIEGQASKGHMPEFSKCRGAWRPDFMVEDSFENGVMRENFRITEINARFSFNGVMHQTFGSLGLQDLGIEAHGFRNAAGTQRLSEHLFKLFRPDIPLHILKEEEPGIDVHMLIHDLQQRFGFRPKFVTPGDLRTLPDPENPGKQKLYCVIKPDASYDHDKSGNRTTDQGEMVEEIFQLGVELLQHELRALRPEMLRQIALVCFNDMRTVLLVHDKRMLGIVRQELEPLVARKVISRAQADILNKGLAETILPRSAELQQLLLRSEESPELRHQYILKPVRGGRGIGIIFPDDIDTDKWNIILSRMMVSGSNPENSYVLQRRIVPRLYDLALDSSGKRVQYPLVGTYHVIQGEFLGLGIWRSNNDRICAISSGGYWLCTVIGAE